MSKKPIVLTILDGWGYRAETSGNAIALARKPVYDKLLTTYPNTLIRASEQWEVWSVAPALPELWKV